MNDPEPTTAQTDQLDARLRDLLAANELELLDRTHLEASWIASHTAEELFDALLTSALKVSDDGALSALVAVALPDDAIAYTLAAVRHPQGEPKP
jgi:hypothetical protein